MYTHVRWTLLGGEGTEALLDRTRDRRRGARRGDARQRGGVSHLASSEGRPAGGGGSGLPDDVELSPLEEETEALRTDPFAIESAIREDLQLARPGETVVRLIGDTTPRIP